MESQIMVLREVAAYLKICPSTLYRMLAKKGSDFPAFKIGADWRFNREQIDQWRKNQERRRWAGR